MKIAIPLTDAGAFSAHYGAAAKFEVFEVDAPQRAVRRRMIVIPRESEPCAWPPLLRAAGVNLVLAGGMGRGAQMRMAEHGLKVLAGVKPAPPDQLIAAWLDERLVGGANACAGPGDGRHSQGEDCHCAHGRAPA